jgi:F0F1-type ATP synthase assembly protein I
MDGEIDGTTTGEPVRRWPTGWVTLAGILVGAGIGALVGAVPLAMAAGLALGVGVDSLLNHLWNAGEGDPNSDDTGTVETDER